MMKPRLKSTPLGSVDPVKPNVSPTQWHTISDLTPFRQPWFAIAGPIVGSWLIVIALLNGGAVLLK